MQPHLVWPEWLPQPLVNALLHSVSRYSEAKRNFLARFEGQYDYDFSVTEINQAPKVVWLKRKFSGLMTIDILEDNWWSLIGSLFHKILEEHAPTYCIVEARQHHILNVNGYRILFHGEPDLYNPKNKTLTDYKFVSATALLYSQQDYIDQLRANAWLLTAVGREIEHIENAYCMRYIDRREKRMNPDYPQTNVVMKSYPILSMEETEGVFVAKIKRILDEVKTPWKKLPDCTPDERWEHGSWAVFTKLKDKKRQNEWSSKAKFRAKDKGDAQTFAKTLDEEHKVEYKSGHPTHCDYCNVIQWCQQRQKELKALSANREANTIVDE